MTPGERRQRDVKLAILEILREEPAQTARDVYIADALAGSPRFFVLTPSAVRQRCSELRDVGGVVVREVEGVHLVTLAEAGRQHLDEILALDGVTRVPEKR
ncbi:MAG: hypothetical protein DI566_13460 [Microbacterium sp.]|nr:MAG: hypothetical protein DI566_13460 [Microbacterium sp.]